MPFTFAFALSHVKLTRQDLQLVGIVNVALNIESTSKAPEIVGATFCEAACEVSWERKPLINMTAVATTEVNLDRELNACVFMVLPKFLKLVKFHLGLAYNFSCHNQIKKYVETFILLFIYLIFTPKVGIPLNSNQLG